MLPDSVILALAAILWMTACYIQARHDAKRQGHLTTSHRGPSHARRYSIQNGSFRGAAK